MTGPPRIGEEGVRRIAELARLRIDPQDIPELARHFDRMLEFVAHLAEVDVDGVAPDIHGERSVAGLRDDAARPAETGEAVKLDSILANAPETEGPYFTTPRVV